MPPANSLANLIPYKKGENGHKGGYNLTERLYHSLNKPLKEPELDAPAGEQIVYKTIKGAIDLVPVAFREAWDRSEGRVPDKTGLSQNINIVFVIGKGYIPQIEGGINAITRGSQEAISEGLNEEEEV